MARKSIKRAESEDFEIFDDDGKIGTIRIRASGILWKPGRKQRWHSVTLEKFAEFATENGRILDK